MRKLRRHAFQFRRQFFNGVDEPVFNLLQMIDGRALLRCQEFETCQFVPDLPRFSLVLVAHPVDTLMQLVIRIAVSGLWSRRTLLPNI
ncbi:MAG: hypothetical protein ABJL55_16200 [Roseibium sp.]